MKEIYADQIYEFLTELTEDASKGGHEEVVRCIDHARSFYVPPVTSEFLGESMNAFDEVLRLCACSTSKEQAQKARDLADSIRKQWFSGGIASDK